MSRAHRIFVLIVMTLLLAMSTTLPGGPVPAALAEEIHATPRTIEPTLSSASPVKSAHELASKVINALGGIEKIRRFNNIPYRALGKIDQISSLSGSSNTLNCELVTAGFCQRITVVFMGQELVTGYDGKHCWTKQGPTIMPTDPVTEQRIKEDLDHGLLLIEKILDQNRKISLGPSKIINGKACPSLQVTADDGKLTTFFVDPSSWMVVRSEYEGVDIEQGVDCLKAYEYLDYRPVEGTLQPFKSIEYSGDKKVTIVTIEKLETGIQLPPNYFTMPSEQKIARLSQGPVLVPFQYISNEILVPVSINGRPPKLFLLDTGATQSILDAACFQDIAPTSTNDEISITTGSGAVKMKYLSLKSVKIADVELNDVPFALADLSKFSQLLNVRPYGLIGANLLKRFLLTIDYDRHELCLQDPDKAEPPPDAIVVATKPSLGISGLAVDGVIDGKLKLSFLIDSGAAFNHVSEALIKSLNREPILPVGIVKGLDGTPVRAGAIRFNTLAIGNKLTVDDPVFSVAPSASGQSTPAQGIISGGSLAIIGNPLLSRYRVTFDYRNQRIFFQDTHSKEETLLHDRFKRIMADYYRTDDAGAAAEQLAGLEADARNRNVTSIAALALANQAVVHGAQKQKFLSPDDLAKSEQKFTSAYFLAMKSNRSSIVAQVLSLWAQYLIKKGEPKDLGKARQLVARALIACPGDSSGYATAGLLSTRPDNTLQDVGPAPGAKPAPGSPEPDAASSRPGVDSPKPGVDSSEPGVDSSKPGDFPKPGAESPKPGDFPKPGVESSKPGVDSSKPGSQTSGSPVAAASNVVDSNAELRLNQALMLDPSNWLALWTKYSIAERSGKKEECRLIARQLKQYYPDAARVKNLPPTE